MKNARFGRNGTTAPRTVVLLYCKDSISTCDGAIVGCCFFPLTSHFFMLTTGNGFPLYQDLLCPKSKGHGSETFSVNRALHIRNLYGNSHLRRCCGQARSFCRPLFRYDGSCLRLPRGLKGRPRVRPTIARQSIPASSRLKGWFPDRNYLYSTSAVRDYQQCRVRGAVLPDSARSFYSREASFS